MNRERQFRRAHDEEKKGGNGGTGIWTKIKESLAWTVRFLLQKKIVPASIFLVHH